MIRAIPFTSIWAGLILWTLLGGALLYFTGYVLYQDFLFAEYGKPVTGMVTRKYYRVSHGRHGSTNYTPTLDYQYKLPGMTFSSECSVRPDTFAEVSTGGVIPIDYVSTQPMDNRINLPPENGKIEYLSWGLTAASLFTVIAGTLTLRFYLRQNQTYRDLLASGLRCRGLVTEIKFDLVGKARTRRDYLIFTFRDNLGREVSGRTWYIKKGCEYLWALQSPIQVYYDPRNSEKFTVDLNSGPPTLSA